MEETIRINFISRKKWSEVLEGFQLEQIQQLVEIRNSDGTVAGNICGSVENNYYINGQPDVPYRSLQAAAEALLKGKR